MQTRKQMTLFTVAILIGFSVSAQIYETVTNNNLSRPEFSTFSVEVSAGKERNTFMLKIDNPEKKKLQIRISHRYADLVIDTFTTEAIFMQRYNMEQADDGHYEISVSAKKEKIVKAIELNTVTTRNVVIH